MKLRLSGYCMAREPELNNSDLCEVTAADDLDDQHEAATVVLDDSAPAAEISMDEIAFDQWSAAQPQ